MAVQKNLHYDIASGTVDYTRKPAPEEKLFWRAFFKDLISTDDGRSGGNIVGHGENLITVWFKASKYFSGMTEGAVPQDGAIGTAVEKVVRFALSGGWGRILNFTLGRWGESLGTCLESWNGSVVACESTSSTRSASVLTETGEDMNLRPSARPANDGVLRAQAWIRLNTTHQWQPSTV